MHGQSTLYDYWMTLYSRKKIIFAVAFSAMLASVVISFYLTPVYEAKASFYVPTNFVAPTYTQANRERFAQPLLKPLPDEKEAGIHVGVLKSSNMAEKMSELFPGKEPSFFKKNVDFVTSPQMFIDIYVRDRDPDMAAAIANSYVSLYKEFHVQSLRVNAEGDQHALESQLKILEKQLAEKSAELESFQKSNNIAFSGDIEEQLSKQIHDLQRELDMTVVDLKSKRMNSGLLESTNSDGVSRYGGGSAIPNPAVENLKKLEARKSALVERIEKLKLNARDNIGTVSTYQEIRGEKRRLEDLRANVLRNLIEARQQGEFPSVGVIQTQFAKAPKNPAYPILALNGVVALLFGFVAGCYNALLLEYLKRLKLDRMRNTMDETPLHEVRS